MVPSLRAVWVPAGTRHRTIATGSTEMRTLYLHPSLGRGRGLDLCRVVAVGPLLRELILRVIDRQMLRADEPRDARLAAVIIDELRTTRETPLDLRLPIDERARRVAERVIAAPASKKTLVELASGCGASGRTIERTFRRELGMTFGRWRQRARLLHSLKLLAGGASVAACAHEAGYETSSAFIAAFKGQLGATPGRFHASGLDNAAG